MGDAGECDGLEAIASLAAVRRSRQIPNRAFIDFQFPLRNVLESFFSRFLIAQTDEFLVSLDLLQLRPVVFGAFATLQAEPINDLPIERAMRRWWRDLAQTPQVF
jgi:hypothetical protein